MSDEVSVAVPGLDVSRETRERLDLFVSELRRWNQKINLISRGSEDQIWSRHVLDSAQVFSLAGRGYCSPWIDLGTGGGFPGLVCAILAHEAAPSRSHILVEADARKAAFLRHVAATCGVNARVVVDRIERCAPLSGGVVSARALAPLAELLSHVARHLSTDGTALLLKGSGFQAELERARMSWSFDLDMVPSITDPAGACLRISNLRPSQQAGAI